MKINKSNIALLILVLFITAFFLLGIWLKVHNAAQYYFGTLIAIAIVFRTQISTLFDQFLEKRHFNQDQLDINDFSLKPRGVTQRLAIATYSLLQAIKEVSLNAPTTLIFFFAVLGAGLIFYRPELIKPSTTVFNDSVIPNLFVFTLDGFLISGLFGYYSNRQNRLQKEQLRLVLRSFLIKYAVKTAESLKLDDDVPKLLRTEHAPLRILNRFSGAAYSCTEEERNRFAKIIKEVANSDITQAAALIGISASLSSAHAELWFRTVNKIQQLSDSSPSSWIDPLIDVLGALVELDQLNFKGEKNTLNIQQMMNLR